MKTLEHQLARYGDLQKELHGPVTVEELAMHARATPPRQPRRGVWVAMAAAAVVFVVVIPILLRSDGTSLPFDTPSETPATSLTTTTLLTTTTSLQTAPIVTSGPPGSIAWTFVPDDGRNLLPDGLWHPMAFTGSEYIALTVCEQQGISELWTSQDGFAWSSEEIPCDTELVPIGDAVARTKDHGEPDVLFKEANSPWTEQRLLVSKPNGESLHPSDTIWELDDESLVFNPDFVLWEGYEGYVTWIFEFDDQIISYHSEPNQRFSRLHNLKAYRTENNSVWEEIANPPFFEQGFIHGASDGSLTRSMFAHHDSIAVAVLSNGRETRMWRTVNGTQWDDITPSQLVTGGVWNAGDIWIQGLDRSDSSNSSLDFLVSTDGLHWESASIPAEYRDVAGTVSVAGNKIFVFGNGGLLVGSYNPETTDNLDP